MSNAIYILGEDDRCIGQFYKLSYEDILVRLRTNNLCIIHKAFIIFIS